MFGARKILKSSPLHRLIGKAMAQDLRVLVVPGPELALSHGLDLPRSGMQLARGPRDANVLLLLAPFDSALRDAASIVYAQMPRPRAIIALGLDDIAPLPAPDASAPLSQDGLLQALASIRVAFGSEAFSRTTEDFDAPALQSKIEYTCPMHPEIVRDEPGNCPICGMFLMPRETDATATPAPTATAPDRQAHDDTPSGKYTCPMHPEVISDKPGDCPKCGMFLVPVDEEAPSHTGHETMQHGHAKDPVYTCPMHPEVTSDEPGDCPKCGMHLVPQGKADEHAGHQSATSDTAEHAHKTGDSTLIGLEPGFMSMVEMTEGTPRSTDGLQMEWITTPFGPFFPGLPGGLTLDFTLDGDTVTSAETGSLVPLGDLLGHGSLSADEYPEKLAARMPLSPMTYRILAYRAIEAADGNASDDPARDPALAYERILNRLSWLAQQGRQLGLPVIEGKAASLYLALHNADHAQIRAQAPALRKLVSKIRRTPFLSRRLAQTGALLHGADWSGPGGAHSTASERMSARLDALLTDIETVDTAKSLVPAAPAPVGTISGHGHASVETARGPAKLHLELKDGQVASAQLDTPSARHLPLVGSLVEQNELADALVAVASLDLSPWEVGA